MDEKSLTSEVNSWSKRLRDGDSRSGADGCASRKRVPIVAYYKNQRRIFTNSGDLNEWLSEEDKRI